MFPGLRLASVLLLSLALLASAGVIKRSTSPVTLPLTKHYNLTGASKILELDQARAKALVERAKSGARQSQLAGSYNVPLVSQAVYYSTTVGIGNPPRNFSLLIDTGSSNTWVGAQLNRLFLPSLSTLLKFTGDLVYLLYGSGLFIGLEYTDTVYLNGLRIKNQGFGGALLTYGFGGTSGGPDGILGIGPVDLTCGTLFPHKSKCVPTVTDNAFKQKLIGAHEVGISFAPTTSVGDTNGELTFGGTDLSKINGTLTYVPITTTSPASAYVGINQTVSYGDEVILANSAGITDTGTTLILLATGAFNQYQNLTGAVMDQQTGLLRVTPEQFSKLSSLFFTIGETQFELIPNAQAWPRQLNSVIGGSSDYVYLIVGDIGPVIGGGLIGGGSISFINGMSFLERFYHVYDAGNNLAGFAPTNYTYALIN
ncbi:transporter [Ganoderma sinense ZZ0214-1]|uniref:Transporter n=1 Tax=Ganoderma sinense ZZ0214-1 TaxID=1077348 RepID=A0A2G8S4J3_9APHY|nr:transporter [Ganoderma sinense ZZ0214-1]